MRYTDKRKQIDELQSLINSHGSLSSDVKKKINYKFRLDWNYYSNSMEGNTLTIDETRSVMVGNLTVGGKPLKDVFEMKGHDEVISNILKIGKGDLRLSESRIKEIHRGIMHEEDDSRKKNIGIWKTEPNYIYNYKGERFDFAPPAEVADKMHELLNKTNAAIDAIKQNKKDAPHPVDVALQFHLDYVLIHPFYDGNGRTARILTNLLLISFGYPPFWIKTNERQIYGQYIGDIQGYGGMPDLFYEFAANMLLRSQQLVMDAIEGKDLTESGDLDKKIQLLEKELESIDSNEIINVELNVDYFENVLNTWGSELFTKAVSEIQKFNRLFTSSKHSISIVNLFCHVQFVNEPAYEIIEKLLESFALGKDKFQTHEAKIVFQTSYGTFIKGGLKTFGCNYRFEIIFDQIKYQVSVSEFGEKGSTEVILFERLLHKPLTSVEINEVVTKLTNSIYDHIDFHSKKNGLR